MDSMFKSMPDWYVPSFQQLTSWMAWYKIGTEPGKIACKLFIQEVWLPGMGSNHELDKI